MSIQDLYKIIIPAKLSYIIIDKLFENTTYMANKIKTLCVLIYYENILLHDKTDIDVKYYDLFDNIIIATQLVSFIIHKPYIYDDSIEDSYEHINPYDIYYKIIQHIITLLET